MIRFIDLRGQILLDDTPMFAFFDTVQDRFVEDSLGDQAWSCKHEFVDGIQPVKGNEFIERCLGLTPDWVPDTESRELAEP